MSPKTIQSWYITVTITSVLGILDQFFNLLGGMITFLLYMTIAILGKVGFPVWKDSLNSWNWPDPNVFGYGLSICLWFILLYVFVELKNPSRKEKYVHKRDTNKDKDGLL